jgi:hypothetical protein
MHIWISRPLPEIHCPSLSEGVFPFLSIAPCLICLLLTFLAVHYCICTSGELSLPVLFAFLLAWHILGKHSTIAVYPFKWPETMWV